jgi:hypothetical protein
MKVTKYKLVIIFSFDPIFTFSWSLRASPGQRLELRFLDLSLRERKSNVDPGSCIDSVVVSERGKTLMRMCGEAKDDIRNEIRLKIYT